jgi:hypothetical protein
MITTQQTNKQTNEEAAKPEKTHSLQPPRQNPFRRRRHTPPRPLQIPQRRPAVHLREHLLDALDGGLSRAYLRRRVARRSRSSS